MIVFLTLVLLVERDELKIAIRMDFLGPERKDSILPKNLAER